MIAILSFMLLILTSSSAYAQLGFDLRKGKWAVSQDKYVSLRTAMKNEGSQIFSTDDPRRQEYIKLEAEMVTDCMSDGYGPACFSLAVVADDASATYEYAQDSCLASFGDGCWYMGTLSGQGIGTPKNEPLARELYIKACELESAMGCRAASLMLYRGASGPQQPERGTELMEKACKLGFDPEYCQTSYIMLAETAEYPRDYLEALAEVVERECIIGEMEPCLAAQIRRALPFTDPETCWTEQNDGCQIAVAALSLTEASENRFRDLIFELKVSACLSNVDNESCQNLAEVDYSDPVVKAYQSRTVDVLERSCRNNNIYSSCYWVFETTRNQDDRDNHDPQRARDAIEISCAINAVTCFEYGTYLNSHSSDANNGLLAIEMMIKACRVGRGVACVEAASLMRTGSDGMGPESADTLLNQACGAGITEACAAIE